MRPNSVTTLLLKALIPYTKENIKLTFKPAKFFADLERSSRHSQQTLRTTYDRARRSGLISNDPVPKLTAKGHLKIAPFTATHLGKDAKLMIIFDIPEHSSFLRNRLRRLLKNLKFRQVQKSVWITDYDYREILRDAIKELDLSDHVQIYECAKLDT